MSDEFYVGYLERAPRGLARFTRRLVLALAVVAPLVALWIALAQSVLPDGEFEFGVRREFEGVLVEEPVPLLRTETAALLLVGAGKRGLPAYARGHHGRLVRFRGSLIRQGDLKMIEMNDPASFEVLGNGVPITPGADGDRVTLAGELVDTKCYLGVMRPATGKVHRACAARCLKGGVPPGLLVAGPDGASRLLLLAGAPIDPEWAGRRVIVEGTLEREEGLLLRADRASLSQ